MLKDLIQQESDRKNKLRIYKIVIIGIVVLLMIIGFFIFQDYLINSVSNSIAVIFPEEGRNVKKFYNIFETPEIGKDASLFRLRDGSTDELFDLGKERDHSVLLIFQVTTCPSCLSIETEISAIQHKLGGKIEVISLGPDEKNIIREHMKEYQIDRKWLYDEKGTVSLGYRVDTLPAWFLLDKDNVVKYMGTGYIEADEIIAEMQD